MTWNNSVEHILEDLGLNDIYINRKQCDIKLCRERILEEMNNELVTEISKKSKLRTYMEFKIEIKPEEYLCEFVITLLSQHDY